LNFQSRIPVSPTRRKWRHEDGEFDASLGYTVGPCLKKLRKKKMKEGRRQAGREKGREEGREGRKKGGREEEIIRVNVVTSLLDILLSVLSLSVRNQ
jgi:hypothetical protein